MVCVTRWRTRRCVRTRRRIACSTRFEARCASEREATRWCSGRWERWNPTGWRLPCRGGTEPQQAAWARPHSLRETARRRGRAVTERRSCVSLWSRQERWRATARGWAVLLYPSRPASLQRTPGHFSRQWRGWSASTSPRPGRRAGTRRRPSRCCAGLGSRRGRRATAWHWCAGGIMGQHAPS